jgi:hypothetical protein
MKLNFPTALLLAVFANLIPGGVSVRAKADAKPKRRARVRRAGSNHKS